MGQDAGGNFGLGLINGAHATLSATGSCAKSSTGTLDLLPGTTASGTVVVSVPVTERIIAVVYKPPFGLTATATWRVNDTAPPTLPAAVRKPRVRTCMFKTYTGATTIHPTTLYSSCDTKYTVVLTTITWTTWNTTSAHGTGVVGTYACDRAVITSSTEHCYAASIALSDPISAAGALVFAHLNVVSSGGPSVTVTTSWGA